ncbi:MAG: F0F1 ATP synthase subunit gamma [Candidatus Omnitrophica bacterium]|nr:F0F1 ATP synthase subunit gamma [Candidatus Omnitrophota bacterium]
MQALPQIKKDIEFNKNLHSLVEVLKSIAVAHYHVLERKIKSESKFFEILQGFFGFPHLKNAEHPFLTKTDRPLGIVAVTSDMGLLGGLNMKVMTAALEDNEKGNSRLIIVGEKGHALVREKKLPFVAFPGVRDEERFAQSMALRDFLIEEVLSGKLGGLEIIYPEPVSFLVQRIKKYVLLPFSVPDVSPGDAVIEKEAIIESHLSDAIEYLISLWLGQTFYEILGYSRLAELSARFVHLENSSQKLQDYEKQLRLKYFKVRHELIDRSMREIFSARSLYVAGAK